MSPALSRLISRYGDCCHICGLPMALDEPGPLAPSRDHVQPRARGGLALPDNTLPAHAWCNSLRGSIPIGLLNDAFRDQCAAAIRQLAKGKRPRLACRRQLRGLLRKLEAAECDE